jgi:putative glutamine amidotransferase
MRKPVIGITPCSKLPDYVESVKKAGGEPHVLSTSDDPAGVLARVDALLLTGGPDVDPSLYGESPHERTEVDADRDRFEVPLSRAALDQDVPVFAVCRGVQVLNVAAGGSLVQDLPTQAPSAVTHSIDSPADHIAHPVRVTPGTHLAETLGRLALESCSVNSRHHQALARVAPGFVVSAVSPDGVIEAIERPSSTFCLGVQWHPENFWRTGEFDGLFRAFIEAARRRR